MNGKIFVESERKKGTVISFHIWLELPDENAGKTTANTKEQEVMSKLYSLSDDEENESVWVFGEAENLEEIRRKLSKLILSIEMDNWEKAEMFAETVKQLTKHAPAEVKSAAFRLKMAVQKGDYEKSTTAYETLQSFIHR